MDIEFLDYDMKNWKDFKTDLDLRKNYIGISTDQLWEIFLDVKEDGLCDDIDINYVSMPSPRLSGFRKMGYLDTDFDNSSIKIIEISFTFNDLFTDCTPSPQGYFKDNNPKIVRDKNSDRFKRFESKIESCKLRLHRFGYKMEFNRIGYSIATYLISRIKEVE